MTIEELEHENRIIELTLRKLSEDRNTIRFTHDKFQEIRSDLTIELLRNEAEIEILRAREEKPSLTI